MVLPAPVSVFPSLDSLGACMRVHLCFDWAFAQLIVTLLTSLHCGRTYFPLAAVGLDIPLVNRRGAEVKVHHSQAEALGDVAS